MGHMNFMLEALGLVFMLLLYSLSMLCSTIPKTGYSGVRQVFEPQLPL